MGPDNLNRPTRLNRALAALSNRSIIQFDDPGWAALEDSTGLVVRVGQLPDYYSGALTTERVLELGIIGGDQKVIDRTYLPLSAVPGLIEALLSVLLAHRELTISSQD